MNVKLSTIEDVKKFVTAATMSDGEIDLRSGRYVVDAKSIMGIFSLDLMSPIEVTIHSDDSDTFVEAIKNFIVE